MSGRLVGEVFRYAPADLTPAQMLILAALAEQAFDTDRTARRSNARQLADSTHLGYGTVKNALSELVARGILVRDGIAHRGRAQNYKLAQLTGYHQSAVHLLPVERDPRSATPVFTVQGSPRSDPAS